VEAILNTLWACLGDQERLRLVKLAADLVIERAHQHQALEPMQEEHLAEALKRWIAEMRFAGAHHADPA
jgi:hypothetical protein